VLVIAEHSEMICFLSTVSKKATYSKEQNGDPSRRS